MNTAKPNDNGNIRVADITLAQLSRGLYKSTASVFKELVSNAHDADATEVRINTNYPEFDFISCVDNGQGMLLKEFRRYFSDEGIGSCIKRKHLKNTTDIYKRPIIGKLGIGMLAIAQLCDSFQIESHYTDEDGKEKAYKGEIILTDEFPFSDKEQVSSDNNEATKIMDIGTWKYETIDYEKAKKGFRIYSSDIRKTFRRQMKSSIDAKQQEKMSFNLSGLHSAFYSKSIRSIRECGPYLEAIWELAILCPLPYYDDKKKSPINNGDKGKFPIDIDAFSSKESKSGEFNEAIQFIQKRQQKLQDEKFRVYFDGIELRRHIQLPTEDDTIPKLYYLGFDEEVYGSQLKFSGYLFAQVPRAIRPLELNGIQIRLKGVGIGGYDSTFLKYYKQIETIRNKWVSGEIFVDNGLEIALNIDRDSFNEHDEHFKKFQSILHDKLDKIFKYISNISKESHSREKDKFADKFRETLQNTVREESNEKLKLVLKELGKQAPAVEVNQRQNQIILNTTYQPLKKKKVNLIIQAIEVAYYTAKESTDNETDRHNKFIQLLQKMLNEIV